MSVAEVYVDPRDQLDPLPSSVEAEQALLGALLYEPQALDLIEVELLPGHFYEPFHGRLFKAFAETYQAGDQPDPTLLAEEFRRDQAFNDLGGLRYLADLIDRAPPAVKAPAYAAHVVDLHNKRRLIELALDLAAAARQGATKSTELLDRMEAELMTVRLSAVEPAPLVTARSAGIATLDQVEAEVMTGRPKGAQTGLTCFDRLGGLIPTWLVVIGGRTSMGKAQPLDAQVLLADGRWRQMGDLRLGDSLASIDGRPSRVGGIFPQGLRDVFRVRFSDGRSTECCAEHLWRVGSSRWADSRVISTAQLNVLLARKRYRRRLWIAPFSGDFGGSEELPIEPWALGALLGDGELGRSGLRFSTADTEMVERIALATGTEARAAGGYDWRLVGPGARKGATVVLRSALRELGLWGLDSENKFIPAVYLRASKSSRLALLQGLLDTDGWAETFGAVRFATSSPRLAHDVQALVRSLGGVCSRSSKHPVWTAADGQPRPGLLSFVLSIRLGEILFSLDRKLERTRHRQRPRRLTIIGVEHSRLGATQCIAVTHPARLYITDDYIPTHNTAVARSALFGAAARNPGDLFGMFSLEMPTRALMERAISASTRGEFDAIETHKLTRAKVQLTDLAQLRGRALEMPENLMIDDRPHLSVQEIRRAVWRLKGRGNLRAIAIDYLQLMRRGDGKGRTDAALIGDITQALKTLAKEAHICVVLLSQLNRSLESRDNKRPTLADLRESGSIEQDADVVLFPYREAYYLERAEPDKGTTKHTEWETQLGLVERDLDVAIAKNRQGAIGSEKQFYDPAFDFIRDW